MAITSIKTGSSFTNLKKYNDFLAGNEAYNPPVFESIATVTVGSGGASSISFTSIPSTYQHLQVRGISRTNRSPIQADGIYLRLNSDSGTNYSQHTVAGDGSSAYSFATTSTASPQIAGTTTTAATGSAFGAMVIDVLDYANTNKYKTLRVLYGYDDNTANAANVGLSSALWQNTNAISTLTIFPVIGTQFNQYSSFALYGIKG